MASFGQHMKELRVTKGLTLETVARRLDTHKGYVSGIERGKVNPPSAKLVRRFAKVFGLPYEDLLVEAELEKIHPDVREFVRSAVKFGRERILGPAPVPKQVAGEAGKAAV